MDGGNSAQQLWWKTLFKRKWRIPLLGILGLTAAGIIWYGFKEKTVFDYQTHNCTIMSERVKARTACYTRNEIVTYPVFFNLGFGLLGIILGTFIDRFSLFLEECCFQQNCRCNESCSKVFKACFSGIYWPGVVLVLGIVVLGCLVGKRTSFTLADIIYILSGIGVGPLVTHVLNLNTQSEVDVSRILEEKEMYPGYALAWSYYFNHLKPSVQKFHRAISKRQTRTFREGLHPRRNNEIELSQNKLLLLLPPSTDLTQIDRLVSFDKAIVKIKKNSNQNSYPFSVYHLPNNQYYAMKCVKEPIIALRKMKSSASVKFVTDDSYQDEIKRFYKRLCEILENPPDDEFAMMGLVVLITVKTGEREILRNGGLSSIITSNIDNTLAQTKIPPLNKNTLQNTEDGAGEKKRLISTGYRSHRSHVAYGSSTSDLSPTDGSDSYICTAGLSSDNGHDSDASEDILPKKSLKNFVRHNYEEI